MQLRKAWVRFFFCALLIIGLLSAVMLIVFYNSSAQLEADRTEKIEEFVRSQRNLLGDAEDIQQLTNSLAEQFQEQRNRAMAAIALWCLALTSVALIAFMLLGWLFFRHADTEFKIMDDLTNMDTLTEIYNRRYMENELQRIMNSLSRSNGLLSILLIDIDFYKLYNDTYGHQQGDVCLKAVAQTLADVPNRATDFTARYGGEEFAVVLPDTAGPGACTIANKLLNNVYALNIPHEKNAAAPYVTISIGVTSGRVVYMQDWKDYMKRADEALYASKHNGRNRYTYLDFQAGEKNGGD